MVHFMIDAPPVRNEHTRELLEEAEAIPPGEDRPDVKESKFVGRFNPRSQVREGQAVEVAVDTRALHFFDKDNGLGIYDQAHAEQGVVAA